MSRKNYIDGWDKITTAIAKAPGGISMAQIFNIMSTSNEFIMETYEHLMAHISNHSGNGLNGGDLNPEDVVNIVFCNTAAQLTSIDPLEISKVILLGLDTINDGKGGIFYWDSSSSLETSNDVIEIAGVIVGRWIRCDVIPEVPEETFDWLQVNSNIELAGDKDYIEVCDNTEDVTLLLPPDSDIEDGYTFQLENQNIDYNTYVKCIKEILNIDIEINNFELEKATDIRYPIYDIIFIDGIWRICLDGYVLKSIDTNIILKAYINCETFDPSATLYEDQGSVEWNFGDGTTSALPNPPEHDYGSVGDRVAILDCNNGFISSLIINGMNSLSLEGIPLMIKLTKLDLRNNNLEAIGLSEGSSISDLTNLEEVLLNDNWLTDIGDIYKLVNLTKFHINDNAFSADMLATIINHLYINRSVLGSNSCEIWIYGNVGITSDTIAMIEGTDRWNNNGLKDIGCTVIYSPNTVVVGNSRTIPFTNTSHPDIIMECSGDVDVVWTWADGTTDVALTPDVSKDLSGMSGEHTLYISDITKITKFSSSLSHFTTTAIKDMVNVTELVLSNVLSGSISNLTDMSSLIRLDVSNNPSLTGDISNLSDMVELQYLKLSDTGVTGNILSFIHLNDILELELDSINVSGDIADLASLTKLTRLIIQGTAITGNISAIENMLDLKVMWAAGLGLTGNITTIANMIDLEWLLLHNNNINLTNLSFMIEQIWSIKGILGNNDFTLSIQDNADLDATSIDRIEGTNGYLNNGLVQAGCSISYDGSSDALNIPFYSKSTALNMSFTSSETVDSTWSWADGTVDLDVNNPGTKNMSNTTGYHTLTIYEPTKVISFSMSSHDGESLTFNINNLAPMVNLTLIEATTNATETIYSEVGYIYGGWDKSTYLQDCDAFNGSVWSSKADMPTPARRKLAASTIGSSGYIYGGYDSSNVRLQDCDAFDGSTWTSKANMPSPERHQLAASTIGSSGYVYGGCSKSSYLQDCDAFDGSSWTSKADMPSPIRCVLAASTIGSNGYVYGGYTDDGNTPLQDCDAFDGSTWTSKANMPSPGRSRLAASTIGSSGYIYGGWTGSRFLQDCDAFDGSAWASKTDMPAPGRESLASSTIGNSGHIYGGWDGSTYLQDCDAFDGSTWTSKANMPAPGRDDLAASTFVTMINNGGGTITESDSISGNTTTFSNMNNLETIRLSNADITGDIANLSSATDLIEIQLQNTSVTGDISTFTNMSHIEKLCLTNTAISGNLSSLSNKPDLSILDLNDTNVTGNLSALSSTTLLTQLGLSNTSVSGNISTIVNNTLLTELTLDNTDIIGNTSNLSTLTNLVILKLNDTAIIGYLYNLNNMAWEELYLSNTSVNNYITNLETMNSLKVLHIDNINSDIIHLNEMVDKLWSIRTALGNNNFELYIHNNNGLSSKAVEQITGTGAYLNNGLVTTGCSVTYLPNSIGTFIEFSTQSANISMSITTSESIETIWYWADGTTTTNPIVTNKNMSSTSGNHRVYISDPSKVTAFYGYPLDLELDLSDLSSMTTLEHLYFENTNVTGNLSNLENLTSLTEIYLNNTSVTGDIAYLSDMTDLQTIHLSNTDVSGDISSLAQLNLTHVVMDHTNITGSIFIFTGMFNLRTLILNHNNVTGTFSGDELINLEIVHLNNTLIYTWIPNLQYDNIKQFYINDTNIISNKLSTQVNWLWENRVALGNNNAIINIQNISGITREAEAQILGEDDYIGDGLVQAGCTVTYLPNEIIGSLVVTIDFFTQSASTDCSITTFDGTNTTVRWTWADGTITENSDSMGKDMSGTNGNHSVYISIPDNVETISFLNPDTVLDVNDFEPASELRSLNLTGTQSTGTFTSNVFSNLEELKIMGTAIQLDLSEDTWECLDTLELSGANISGTFNMNSGCSLSANVKRIVLDDVTLSGYDINSNYLSNFYKTGSYFKLTNSNITKLQLSSLIDAFYSERFLLKGTIDISNNNGITSDALNKIIGTGPYAGDGLIDRDNITFLYAGNTIEATISINSGYKTFGENDLCYVSDDIATESLPEITWTYSDGSTSHKTNGLADATVDTGAPVSLTVSDVSVIKIMKFEMQNCNIDIQYISHFTSLEILRLMGGENAYSTRQITGSLSNLNNLTSLTDLAVTTGSESIDGIAELDALVNLTSLEYTNYGTTFTENLSVVLNMPGLLKLHVSGAKIVGDPNNLTTLTQLTSLKLLNSAMSSDSFASLPFPNLTVLHLHNVPVASSLVGALTNLVELYAHRMNGNISKLTTLINLEYLDLGDNSACSGNFSSLSNLINLKHLNLRNTTILINLTSLTGLTQLEYLYLGNNSMYVVGSIESIANLTNITTLYLTQCTGIYGPISAIRNMENLEHISIVGTEISGSIDTVIPELTKLKTFDASGSSIGGLLSSFNDLEDIEYIVIDDTGISGSFTVFNNKTKLWLFSTYNSAVSSTNVSDLLAGFWTYRDVLLSIGINIKYSTINTAGWAIINGTGPYAGHPLSNYMNISTPN